MMHRAMKKHQVKLKQTWIADIRVLCIELLISKGIFMKTCIRSLMEINHENNAFQKDAFSHSRVCELL